MLAMLSLINLFAVSNFPKSMGNVCSFSASLSEVPARGLSLVVFSTVKYGRSLMRLTAVFPEEIFTHI